jgi:phenylalanyl-tRNA synthetase beta chain
MRPIDVRNAAPKICSRYQAVVMENVAIGPSPWWVKNRLRLAGIRPINNIVDITNYVMLEYGQPMHAFDYDRIGGQTIIVRTAKDGETIKTLDGQEVRLSDGQLVIADESRPMAVAGVMGGEDSAVHSDTKTIVFESACFDPVSVRRTARVVNLHTDSSLRFEKGLPEEQTYPALARAIELCQEIACGRIASPVADVHQAQHRKVKFMFRPGKAEELIGVSIPKAKMVSILKSLGFIVSPRSGSAKNARYEITVPYWRERDIEGERDFAEEIARIYGYHNLPSLLPTGEIPIEQPSPVLTAERKTREFLRGAGYTEVLNYSFISKEQIERCGRVPESALRVANPLSADFEYMRPNLIPGALSTIKDNQGFFPEGRFFEVSNVYLPRPSELPDERIHVFAAVYGPAGDAEAYFREIKGIFESYCRLMGLEGVALRRLTESRLWHPGRNVEILVEGRVIGVLGEIHTSVLKRFGIDGRTAAMDIDLAGMISVLRPVQRYRPVSPFPPVLRDLAFVVDERTEYDALASAVREASGLLKDLELFDVYRGAGIGDGKKSLALHLSFSQPDRTLTADEADKVIEAIKRSLAAKFGAVLRA